MTGVQTCALPICLGRCVWFPVASPMAVSAASASGLSSPSSRSGFVAGEVVEVLRRARPSLRAPLAGRGGEGRSWWWALSRFWCRWLWWSSSLLLLRLAMAARGAVAAEAVVRLEVVVLGVGETAGRRVDAGSRRCGCARSWSPDSGAQRRMVLAAVYNKWWRLLPGEWWYGVSGAA